MTEDEALLKYKPIQFALVVIAQVHDKSIDSAGVAVSADLSQRVPFSSLHSLFNIGPTIGPLWDNGTLTIAGLQVLRALETYFIFTTNSLVKYNTGYNVLEIAIPLRGEREFLRV